MTAPRDLDRLIRAFIDEGRTELPDHAFDDVRRRIDRTRQRAPFGPWRNLPMPATFRLLLAAAIGIAALVLGASFIGGRLGPSPDGSPSTRPSTAVSQPATPAPEPTYDWPVELAARSYTTSLIWDVPFAFTFDFPEGWTGYDVELSNEVEGGQVAGDRRGVSLMFSRVQNTYADPCASLQRDPPVEQTVASIAEGLASIAGVNVTTPRESTFAGRPATYLELVVPRDPACGFEGFHLWTVPLHWMRMDIHMGGGEFRAERDRYRIWLLDIEGIPFMIAGLEGAEATAAEVAQLDTALASITIGPPVETSAIGSCDLAITSPAQGRAPLEAPYRIAMGNGTYDLNGPVPVGSGDVPLTPDPPFAQIDLGGAEWSTTGAFPGPPELSIVPPSGSPSSGFATSTEVGGFQGSAVFDAPGTWWVRVASDAAKCSRQFPVEVLPVP